MSAKSNLQRALRAIKNAKDNIARARHVDGAHSYARRALIELDDAEKEIIKAIRDID